MREIYPARQRLHKNNISDSPKAFLVRFLATKNERSFFYQNYIFDLYWTLALKVAVVEMKGGNIAKSQTPVFLTYKN